MLIAERRRTGCLPRYISSPLALSLNPLTPQLPVPSHKEPLQSARTIRNLGSIDPWHH
jgi:hypothetical protein